MEDINLKELGTKDLIDLLVTLEGMDDELKNKLEVGDADEKND